MEDIFIKSIKINSVRHLKDLTIPLSDTERKLLMITGKNGSGKTSVLEEIKNDLYHRLYGTAYDIGSLKAVASFGNGVSFDERAFPARRFYFFLFPR